MTKTACDTCQGNLDSGEVTWYRNGLVYKTICFKCDKKERFEEYLSTNKISTKLMLDASMIVYDLKNGHPLKEGEFTNLKSVLEINEAVEKLQIQCKEFESKVWFNGLQAEVHNSKFKGLSAKNDSVQVLTYAMCGRCMITINSGQDKDYDHITFITSEDGSNPVMGIQGIHCTYEKAAKLINTAIENYIGKDFIFAVDKEVNIGI